jgi:hypothetical protein
MTYGLQQQREKGTHQIRFKRANPASNNHGASS